MKLHSVKLVSRVYRPEEIPTRGFREISFVGRSNVGKSSALNNLLGRKALSPVSKSPGRTREILYFLVNEAFYFVDLPGYGYAHRSRKEREKWLQLMRAYLARKENPKGIVHILDIRHDPSALDLEMISWLSESARPTLFLLTKSDKLSSGKVAARVRRIARELGQSDEDNLISFSAKTGAGKREVWGAISELLGRKG